MRGGRMSSVTTTMSRPESWKEKRWGRRRLGWCERPDTDARHRRQRGQRVPAEATETPDIGAGVRSLRRATWGGGPGTGQDQHRPKCGQAARIQTPSWLPSRLSLSAPPAMDASSPELRTSILDWDENDVHAWLTKLGFPQYEQQVKGTSAQYPSVDTNSPQPPSRAQHIRRCPMPS